MRALRHIRAVSFAAFVTAGAAGCNHGGSSPIPPTVPPPNNPFANAGFLYDSDFVADSQFVKPATFGNLGVDVIVKPQNYPGLEQYANGVETLGSSNYAHFLTPQEIADRFFATASDYAAAAKYLQRHGLQVHGWTQRYILHANGTQAQLEHAFSTRFGWYRHRNEVYLAPMTAPSVPKGVPIAGALNLVYRTKLFTPSLVGASNGLQSGYTPQQLQVAFDYAGAYNVGYLGSGITIGVIGTGPVSIQSTGHLGDLEAMRALYHAQGTNTITIVSPSGNGFSTPPPVTAQCQNSSNPQLPPSQSPTNNCNPEDIEAQADTEQTALLAPAAAVKFYLAYEQNAGQGFTAQGLPLAADEISDALKDNTSDILSMSFGADEQFADKTSEISTLEPMFKQAIVQGISVFASAGDNGAYACQDGLESPNPFENDFCVAYPASSPEVTAVGGVTTPLNSAGQFIGPIVAWGESTTRGLGGTGGGTSAFFPIPTYQAVCPVPRDNKGCPTPPNRNVPDVSLDGDPLTGVSVIYDADPSIGPRQILPFGGTSVAAPEMAAMWAEVLSACKVKPGFCVTGGYRTGNANPILYNIFAERGTATWESTFFDVLYGTNGGFPGGTPAPSTTPTLMPGQSAGKGYDLVSGIGVPFTRALIKAVAGL